MRLIRPALCSMRLIRPALCSMRLIRPALCSMRFIRPILRSMSLIRPALHRMHGIRLIRPFLHRSFSSLQFLAALPEPFSGIRIALRERIDLENEIFDPRIALPAGIGFYKPYKPLPALGIGILQKLLHHISPQQQKLPLISDPKRRIQI